MPVTESVRPAVCSTSVSAARAVVVVPTSLPVSIVSGKGPRREGSTGVLGNSCKPADVWNECDATENKVDELVVEPLNLQKPKVSSTISSQRREKAVSNPPPPPLSRDGGPMGGQATHTPVPAFQQPTQAPQAKHKRVDVITSITGSVLHF
jgi:hypothetical protein